MYKTPYSFVWMDLRAQPVVLTLPTIEERRYYSVQLIDAYKQNFAYLGTRSTVNNGGHFMVAGPNWQGQQPLNIDWPKPTPTMSETPALFRYLNFMLSFAPAQDVEKDLLARSAKIGVEAGKPFKLKTGSHQRPMAHAVADSCHPKTINGVRHVQASRSAPLVGAVHGQR